ncbi:MAG: alkaline phosphatase family protein [Candidatus Cloacimonetes bacterium]|nr:alkaline phosphatase family protein [Candidatus Cloacimonadota bacterium]
MYPDYKNSIVNLMGTLSRTMKTKPLYEPLAGLDADYLAEKETIIMLNIDAMGFELVQELGKGTILGDNVKFEMTSIFPTTTATATVAYQTGMAALNHGLTGWFVNLKEVGTSSTILLYAPRFSRLDYQQQNIDVSRILNCGNIYENWSRDCYGVTNKSIIETPVTQYLSGKSVLYGHKDLKGFARNILKAAHKKSANGKYIYGYWSFLDHLEHKTGPDSSETAAHFQEICATIEYLQQKLHKKNYVMLISTDHGMIKVTPEREMSVDKFPELPPMLNLPFSGEPRVPYCYVKPEYKDRFEQYVQNEMSEYCELFSRQEVIDKGWYGLGEENPRFRDRIGDYILLMKENYVLKDQVFGEKGVTFKGYHGGMSSAEMRIPLIIIE